MLIEILSQIWNSSAIDLVFGLGNIILILGLIFVYWKNYNHFKSKFALGLLLFAVFLLVHNLLFVLTLIIYKHFWGSFEHSVMTVVNLSEFIALSILIKVTWE
ncbi:MAG: hypothetical protein CVV28_01005 [Methanobacteriales archaeon HGW-Methanobacteriales-1]|jgi:hypothetical protein|nr:MAG: hypothetical protein CVV28_01005 [Methanobacteriales archaeon HGW-Methanobacteriales-1]